MCLICDEPLNQHEDSSRNNIENNINLNNQSLNNSERVQFKKFGNNDNTVIDLNNESQNNLIPLNHKINKIEIPEEIISELDNPNLCEICFSSDISVDKSVKFTCNHIFCLICVKTYLEKNIENGKVKYYLLTRVLDINCLHGGCPIKINEQMIYFIVDENFKKKYLKFSREQNRKLSKNIINCPYPDCDELIEYDPTYKTRFYKCDNYHKFCSVCKNCESHSESQCKKVKNF